MKPRQSIKTTAKKIGSFQKEIGKDPNRSTVDVRPYGGYTPLSHKIEAGANIEQNYSVNVQNQMQLMKKISEVSTLNTNHMHMQLGQLEKELKQWEKKINEVVKKKSKPIKQDVLRLAPTTTSTIQLTSLKKGLYNSKISQLNKLNSYESINASHWVKRLMHQRKTEVSSNQSTYAIEQFNQTIKILQQNVKETLNQQWSALNNQLLTMVTKVENKNNLAVTSLERVVEKLETSSKLETETIKELKEYYQKEIQRFETIRNIEELSDTKLREIENNLERLRELESEELKEHSVLKELTREKDTKELKDYREYHSEEFNHFETASQMITETESDWTLKTDTFIERLQWIVETTMEAHLEKQVQREIKEWFQEQNLSSLMMDHQLMTEVKENLKNFYKTFEQREWIKELILAESPMVLETLYDGVTQLHEYMVTESRDKKELNETTTVQIFNELIKTLSTEMINRTATFMTKVENNEAKLVECFETLNTFDQSENSYLQEQNKEVNQFIKEELNLSEESNKGNFESTEKTIQWISGLFRLKNHLTTKSILENQKDIEKSYYDTVCVETIDKEYQRIHHDFNSSKFGYSQEIVKWRSWYETLSKVYGQTGFGMMTFKQHPVYQQLAYMKQPIEDEHLVTMLEQLSSYMEQFTRRVNSLETHIDENVSISTRGVTKQLDQIHHLIQEFENHQKNNIKNQIEAHQEEYIREYIKILKLVFDRSKTTYDLKRINHIVKHHEQLKELLKYQEIDRAFTETTSIKKVETVLNSQPLQPVKLQTPKSTKLTFQQQIDNYQELMIPVREMVIETFRELQRSMKEQHDRQSFKEIDGHSIQRYFQNFQKEIQKLSQKSQRMLQMKPHMINQKQLTYYSQILMNNENIDKVSEQFLTQLIKHNVSSNAYHLTDNMFTEKSIVNKDFFTSLSEGSKNVLLNQLWNKGANNSVQKQWLTKYITKSPRLTFGQTNQFNEALLESINTSLSDRQYVNPLLTMTSNLQLHSAMESLFNTLNTSASHSKKSSLTAMNSSWSERITNRVKNFYEKRIAEIRQKHNISNSSSSDHYAMNYNIQSISHKEGEKHNIYESVLNTLQHNKFETNETSYSEQKNSNPYQETLMAYTSEIIQESSEELEKQVVSQQELIELIQKEILELRQEKQETTVNVERLSQAVLKEITHKLRKDRQRKGWI